MVLGRLVRRAQLKRPFTAGMVTDLPGYELGPQNSTYAQDLVAPEGTARQRKGWPYDGNTADAADNLVSVHRNKYILADTTRTITVDDDGELRIHNASAAGTLQEALGGSVQYLPRCVYRDEVILCAQDGLQPLRRYAGANITGTIDDGVATGAPDWTAGEATITGTIYASAPGVGAFIRPIATTGKYAVMLWHKVLESSTTSNTIDGVLCENADTIASATAVSTGYTFPCVPIYSAGSATYTNAGGSLNGFGTKWSTGAVVLRSTNTTGPDGVVLVPDGDLAHFYSLSGVTDDDTLTAFGGDGADMATKSVYQLLRSCNFTDAQAHKGSLFGTGNAYSPNTVYVGPPGWNIAYPPGHVPPFSPTSDFTSGNANDYVMDSVNVPSAYDGDVNVAILSSPNPLLVLKRKSVYGIFGSYPNFSTDKITDNAGCIDLRSAISGPNGQFWAGEEGIFAYVNGQVMDLTDGKINREWRALTRTFDYGTSDYCTIGEVYDHLFISIVTSGGSVNRCYVYDLRNQAWISRFSNHKARYFFSSKVDGESEELYWVGDNDIGRVMRSAATVNGTGIAKDGDGTSPVFAAQTPQNIDGDGSIENDERMLDLAIHANVYDTAGTGTTLTVAVNTGGALEDGTNASKILTGINSDSEDRVDRHYRRAVNTKGRLHQVQLSVAAIGSNNAFTKVEVPEIVATFRTRRDRT